MILGVEGPIQLTDDEPVLMLESFLFDRTGTGHKLETGRISLEIAGQFLDPQMNIWTI